MSLRKLTFSFLAILIVTVSPLFYVSCSDTETTDSSNFALYYTGLTNIAPSMTGTISKPTYKGSAPSDFTITGITLNNEVYTGNCFLIDSETGVISVQNTENAAKGRYKISISCISGGTRYEYKDIVIVKLLASAPDGIEITPNLIQADYSDIIDKNSEVDMPIAKITTSGEEHISIKKYTIGNVYKITNEGEETPEYEPLAVSFNDCFTISSEGEFTIVQGESSSILEVGLYTVDIILETQLEESLLEKKIKIKVISKPMDFYYEVAEGEIEEESEQTPNGTTFRSQSPVYSGSTDGLKYSIYAIEPETEKIYEKIKIDEQTGEIYIEKGHKLTKGSTYKVSVCAKNMYNEEGEVGLVKENAYEIKVVAFIAPFEEFYYGTQVGAESCTYEGMELSSYKIEPNIKGGGENIKYQLLSCDSRIEKYIDKEQLQTNGIIELLEGNKTFKDENYKISVRAFNSKYEIKTELTLRPTKNPDRITYISCGNNLGANKQPLEGKQYDNQFRFNRKPEMKDATFTINTDAYPDANIEFTYTNIHQTIKAEIIDGNKLKFDNNSWNNNAVCGISKITATVNGKVSFSVPIFIHCNGFAKELEKTGNKSVVETGYEARIEYTPFVLHVNPHNGGTSISPQITTRPTGDDTQETILSGDKLEIFALDYRRTFKYYNFNGLHTDNGQQPSEGKFLSNLWSTSGGTPSKNDKAPVSYFTGLGFDQKLGYVINEQIENHHEVKINKNKWYDTTGWANGFFVGEMTFRIDGEKSKLNDGGKTNPIIIWLDENYEE